MAVTFEKKGENSYLLDVTGYVCPHPQLYTKKALQKMKENDILEIIFDNPSSGESISAMCDRNGDEILEKNHDNGVFNFTIKKT
ncbi:MAG: sulfurtransferase TusA family protein [Candidatus Desulfatibia sp.]|uniref:sulfurtransferase TusA family protein n=1 Tax=Candidatus Desulfatibia sp. TaxID=3101189 RepID=UPI002F32F180